MYNFAEYDDVRGDPHPKTMDYPEKFFATSLARKGGAITTCPRILFGYTDEYEVPFDFAYHRFLAFYETLPDNYPIIASVCPADNPDFNAHLSAVAEFLRRLSTTFLYLNADAIALHPYTADLPSYRTRAGVIDRAAPCDLIPFTDLVYVSSKISSPRNDKVVASIISYAIDKCRYVIVDSDRYEIMKSDAIGQFVFTVDPSNLTTVEPAKDDYIDTILGRK